MDIFVGCRENKLATVDFLLDGFQATNNFPRVPRRDDPLARKHFGMGDAAGDIVTVKPRIDIDGSRKSFHRTRGSRGKPSAPELSAPNHPGSPPDFQFWIFDFGLNPFNDFFYFGLGYAVRVAGRSVE